MRLIHLLTALGAGALMPIQAGINARLREFLGDPLLAAFASFSVGVLALFCFILVTGTPWPGLAAVAAAPWWAWIGGAMGACFVFVSVVLAYKLGATALMAWSIAGSLAASVLLDHLGLLGFAAREVSWQRLCGVALLLAGAWLVKEF